VHEAVVLFEECLADCERAFGAEHPATVTVQENLADARRLAASPKRPS
jgi:hypothetical protein